MNRDTAHPLRVRCLQALLAMTLGLFALTANAAAGCYLTCLSDRPACEIALANQAQPLPVPKGALLAVPVCESVTRLTGQVAGFVRVNSMSHDIRADSEAALKAQLARHPRSACLVTETACRAERDLAMLNARAGKPFDGSMQIAPVGQPCALGFPCGLVRMPAGGLVVQLEDRGFDGQLVVNAVRGATGSMRLPVERGRFEVPRSLLVHGASYAYAASRAGGPVTAAGMFSLASENMMIDVEEDRRDALAAGYVEPLASLKAFLRNNFEWDLYVWIRDQPAK